MDTNQVNTKDGRTRAYRRSVNVTKALRKCRINKDISYALTWGNGVTVKHLMYSNLHQYSKNKIHCSCPLCSSKTKAKKNGRYVCVGQAVRYSRRDARNLEDMDMQETNLSE